MYKRILLALALVVLVAGAQIVQPARVAAQSYDWCADIAPTALVAGSPDLNVIEGVTIAAPSMYGSGLDLYPIQSDPNELVPDRIAFTWSLKNEFGAPIAVNADRILIGLDQRDYGGGYPVYYNDAFYNISVNAFGMERNLELTVPMSTEEFLFEILREPEDGFATPDLNFDLTVSPDDPSAGIRVFQVYGHGDNPFIGTSYDAPCTEEIDDGMATPMTTATPATPPGPGVTDWCYYFDFKTSSYNADVNNGQWNAGYGFGTSAYGLSSVFFPGQVSVAPQSAVVSVKRAPDSSGPINVTLNSSNIFGIRNSTILGAMAAEEDYVVFELSPTSYVLGTNFSISLQATAKVYIDALGIYGGGINPFPFNSCGPATQTPIPPATTTSVPTPTAPIPTQGACLLPGQPTPTPDATAGPTPGPSSGVWHEDFSGTLDPWGASVQPGHTIDATSGNPAPSLRGDTSEPTFYSNTTYTMRYNVTFPYDVTITRIEASFRTVGGGTPWVYFGLFNMSGTQLTWSGSTGADAGIGGGWRGRSTTYSQVGVRHVQFYAEAVDGGASGLPEIDTLDIEYLLPFQPPTPYPACTSTPTITPSVSPTPTLTRTPTNTPTPFTLTPTFTRTPTRTPFPTYSPPTAAPTRTPNPTVIPTVLTAPPLNTATPGATIDPGGTLGPTSTATFSGPGVGLIGPSGSGGVPQSDSLSGVTQLGEAVSGLATNMWQRGRIWAGNLATMGSRVFSGWSNAAPTAPPMMPACASEPLAHEVCAIWYMLRFTVFSGTLGRLLIPIATAVLDLFTAFFLFRFARAIIARIGALFKS